MTIEQLDKVDFLAKEEEGNRVVLYISDHLPWDAENEKLLLLQEKINRYLAFLESGEIYENLPDVKHGNFKITAIHKYRPTSEGYCFLEAAQKIIEDAGFQFEWRSGETGYEENKS
jgi:hypothetical protein